MDRWQFCLLRLLPAKLVFVSKETKIDILVTPAVTIIVGVGCAMVLAPIFKTICDSLVHLSAGQRIYSHSSWESLFLLSSVLYLLFNQLCSNLRSSWYQWRCRSCRRFRWQYLYGRMEWSCTCRRSSYRRMLL